MLEWEAYYELEPFGGQWQQTALLASLIANANRDPEKRPEPFTVEDFLPGESGVDNGRSGEADDGEETDEVLSDGPSTALENAPLWAEDEPDWKRWKRNIRAFAERE